MNATDVIMYTFEASLQCVGCAIRRFGANASQMVAANHGYGYTETLSDGSTIQLDENRVRMGSYDQDGNPVLPVFATDEHPYASTTCGTCGSVMCTSCGTLNTDHKPEPGHDPNEWSTRCWNCNSRFTEDTDGCGMVGPEGYRCTSHEDGYHVARGIESGSFAESWELGNGTPWIVVSDQGSRTWMADDESHAREQHTDAFPDEIILSVKLKEASE